VLDDQAPNVAQVNGVVFGFGLGATALVGHAQAIVAAHGQGLLGGLAVVVCGQALWVCRLMVL
jgi:hypothetical protein